ncbi:nitrogen fixation negative regulator NifL [Vibrio nitrifigilis]|uniref:histidine kinase n=1 Tax=Vibrio nitrifigilis TaxID=2789781 RepID=A0ABS0GKH9_9VIBR|nr:nitrogen fixation negative regulator NifL [Vibrio nitrifigilis]MBF9002984.1 nitrogen fixation negative regulator NifL [Vibrio nitrifigilis]
MGQVDTVLQDAIPPMFSDQTFSQIVSNAPVAISITDPNGTILFVNQMFSEITGYTASELVGRNSSLLSYKATPKSVYENLWNAISTGHHWQGQLVNRKKNGQPYIAEISISRFVAMKGDVCYYAIHKDITEAHQTVTNLKNQSVMFEAVLNATPIAITMIDQDHNTLFSNAKFDKIGQSINGSPVKELLDSLNTDYGITSINEFMKNKEHRYKGVHIENKGGVRERWFDYSLVKIPVSDTTADTYFKPQDAFYTVITITERTREKLLVEERRINSVKLMTRDNKYVHAMQEALMATLHQLQGPFNMIDSAMNILKRTSPSCPGLIAMDEAMETAFRAMHDIKQAIPERNSEAFQPVNINQVIRDATAICTDELLMSSTKLDLILSPKLNSINGMPHRLILTLKQLIDNAVDSIQAAKCNERSILITSYAANEETKIIVEDSGGGIADDLRLKVFQPFFSTKPKHQTGCRGIGLSIVQQVLNEHSATITISESDHLKGAYICLTFPSSEW